MIDAPPSMPAEQVIEQKLIACGIDRGTVSVMWRDELQSVEVVIRPDARVSSNQFACLDAATAGTVVTFEDQRLQSAYTDHTVALYRPRMIADAETAVAKLGLIDNFPKRSDHADLRDYAKALERHCGLSEGRMLRVSGDTVTLDPASMTEPLEFVRRSERILAAIVYAAAKGDIVKFGFIGNAAVSDTGK